MPTKRLPMQKIRDALRLHGDCLPKRKIAASLNVGPTSVGAYLRRDWWSPSVGITGRDHRNGHDGVLKSNSTLL